MNDKICLKATFILRTYAIYEMENLVLVVLVALVIVNLADSIVGGFSSTLSTANHLRLKIDGAKQTVLIYGTALRCGYDSNSIINKYGISHTLFNHHH
jgi:hypothetical protein